MPPWGNFKENGPGSANTWVSQCAPFSYRKSQGWPFVDRCHPRRRCTAWLHSWTAVPWGACSGGARPRVRRTRHHQSSQPTNLRLVRLHVICTHLKWMNGFSYLPWGNYSQVGCIQKESHTNVSCQVLNTLMFFWRMTSLSCDLYALRRMAFSAMGVLLDWSFWWLCLEEHVCPNECHTWKRSNLLTTFR